MTDINELEDRITAALDRIRRGVETLGHSHAKARSSGERLDLWPADPQDKAAGDSEDTSGADIRQLETAPKAVPENDVELAAARAEADALRAKVEEERKAAEYLEERVLALKARQDEQIAALNKKIADLRETFAEFEGQIDDVRAANAKVTSHSEKLRAALADDVADAGLINMAMQAEIDALRAARDLDAAEIEAVLALLEPILSEAN